MLAQLVEGTAPTRQAQRRRGGTHKRASSAPALAVNKALNLDDIQRVAHRHARHLVFLNQFPLGGKAVARLQFAGFDLAPKRIRDHQVGGAAALRSGHVS